MRALTPTRAGFAQVFDTSQLVNSIVAMRQKREEALSKSLMDFDPSAVWTRDIPKLSEKVKQYRGFVSENHNKLVSSSENTDVWMKKKQMEDELKYFIAGSKQAQTDYNNALKRYYGDKRFQTAENQEMLYNFSHPDTWGDKETAYSTLSAFDASPLNKMKMNIIIDTSPIMEGMLGLITKFDDKELISYGGDKKFAKKYVYDEAAVEKYLETIWDSGTSKNGNDEIQNRYDGNFEEFKEDMIKQRPQYSKTQLLVSDPSDTESRKKVTIPAVGTVIGDAKKISSSVTATSEDGNVVKGTINIGNEYQITMNADDLANIKMVGIVPTYYTEGGEFDQIQAEKAKSLTITGKMLVARAKTPMTIQTYAVVDGKNVLVTKDVKTGELLPNEIVSAKIKSTKTTARLIGKDKVTETVSEINEADYNQYIEQIWAAKGQLSLQEGGIDAANIGFSATQIGVKGGTKAVIVPWDEIKGAIAATEEEWASKNFSIDQEISDRFGGIDPNVRIVKWTNKTVQNQTPSNTTPNAVSGSTSKDIESQKRETPEERAKRLEL